MKKLNFSKLESQLMVNGCIVEETQNDGNFFYNIKKGDGDHIVERQIKISIQAHLIIICKCALEVKEAYSKKIIGHNHFLEILTKDTKKERLHNIALELRNVLDKKRQKRLVKTANELSKTINALNEMVYGIKNER